MATLREYHKYLEAKKAIFFKESLRAGLNEPQPWGLIQATKKACPRSGPTCFALVLLPIARILFHLGLY